MEGAAPDSDERFAEWYVWAKREVSSDPRVCLGVAQAAVDAQVAGADRDTAEATARRSVAGSAVVLLAKVSPWRRGYAQWYDWARLELGGEPERLHRLTRAAIQRLKSSGDAAQAADAARSAAAADPAPGSEASGESGPGSPWSAGGPPGPGGWGGGSSTATSPAVAGGPPPFAARQGPPSAPATPVSLDASAYAGLGRRLGAAAVDAVLAILGAALVFVVGAIFFLIAVISTRESSGLQEFLTAIALLVIIGAMYWLYDAGLESSPGRATPGKRAVGLVLIDRYGRQVSFGRATARHFVKFVPLVLTAVPLYLAVPALLSGFVNVVTLGLGVVGVIFLIVLVIEVLMAAWTRRKQGLHDLIAGTLVVRRDWASRTAPANAGAPPPVALPESQSGISVGVPRGGETVSRG